MKISYHWLKKYLPFELTVSEISTLLTDIGLEVESVEEFEPIKGGLKGIIVGKVVNCVKHPDADRLHITKVDVGSQEPLQIICGASNVAINQTVLVATVGTKLYAKDGGSFEIKLSKIRGIFSEGMICAEDELGLGDSHDGIMILPANIKIGTHASELYYTTTDFIYEIGLTPNRSDAMSHFGVARDLSAALQCRNKLDIKAQLPIIEKFNPQLGENPIKVTIKDSDNCPRYSGIYVEQIEVKESPDWLKSNLKSMGMNPVNNIVDITNYVMLETGQPLHAFDAKKIKDSSIVVRKALAKKFTTLDGVERNLSGSELMICDAKEELCIAGVFGGKEAGVTTSTTSIFIESAYFNAVSIRKTSKLHGLKTDSSFRFERGVDPEITIYALKRATQLIQEVCPDITYSEICDTYPEKIEAAKITINQQNITALIGKEMSIDEIKNILVSLDFEIIKQDDAILDVVAPLYRTDVTREADVIEELLRIYGFNSIDIPEKLNYTLGYHSEKNNQKEQLKEKISNWLASKGFYESINNSLTKGEYLEKIDFLSNEEAVKILNPLSKELDIMRLSLLPGLMENILLNQNYQQPNVCLFEFGKQYHYFKLFSEYDVLKKYKEKEMLSLVLCGSESPENWKTQAKKSDFFTLKGIIESLLVLTKTYQKLQAISIQDSLFKEGLNYVDSNSKTILRCGIVHPKIIKYFDIKQEVFYAEIDWLLFSELALKQHLKYNELVNFQPVRRDLALLLDKHLSFEDIKKSVHQISGKLLKNVSIFDVYEGDKIPTGKKSYALSFIFQDNEKTMTDKEINLIMDKLISYFKTTMQAELR